MYIYILFLNILQFWHEIIDQQSKMIHKFMIIVLLLVVIADNKYFLENIIMRKSLYGC